LGTGWSLVAGFCNSCTVSYAVELVELLEELRLGCSQLQLPHIELFCGIKDVIVEQGFDNSVT